MKLIRKTASGKTRRVAQVAAADETVAQYLDRLRAGLRDADAALILAEAQDHLYESVAAGLSVGMTQREAEAAAISSFGSVPAVIGAHAAARSPFIKPRPADVIMALWKAAWLYTITMGASGLIVAAMNQAFGPAFVAGANNGTRLTVGIIGAVLLAGYGVIRRRQRRRGTVLGPLTGDYFPVLLLALFAPAVIIPLLALPFFVLNPRLGGPGTILSIGIPLLAVCGRASWILARRMRAGLIRTDELRRVRG